MSPTYVEHRQKWIEENRVVRYFPPLPQEPCVKPDCILHVCGFVEHDALRRLPRGEVGLSRGDRHFKALLACMEATQRAKSSKPMTLVVVVSVNGKISEEFQHELWMRAGQLSRDDLRFHIFQRANYGWHWAGFWDIWHRWNLRGATNCQWWASMEGDWHIAEDNWIERCITRLEALPSGGFVGHVENRLYARDSANYGSLPGRIWCDGQGQPIKIHSEIRHTNGGFYFCRRKLLEDFDRVFGQFTLSLGNIYEYDGVVLGEVGFSQKTQALGWDIIPWPQIIKEYPVEGL